MGKRGKLLKRFFSSEFSWPNLWQVDSCIFQVNVVLLVKGSVIYWEELSQVFRVCVPVLSLPLPLFYELGQVVSYFWVSVSQQTWFSRTSMFHYYFKSYLPAYCKVPLGLLIIFVSFNYILCLNSSFPIKIHISLSYLLTLVSPLLETLSHCSFLSPSASNCALSRRS